MKDRIVKTVAVLLLLVLLTGCVGKQTTGQEVSFDDSTLGVVTGSLYDGYSRTLYPNAKIDYYNTFADLFQCIKLGKIDAFMLDEAAFNAVARTDSRLHSVLVPEYKVELGFGFQKNNGGDVLQGQMNELLMKLWDDGSMEQMIEKWYGAEEPEQTLIQPDFSDNLIPLNVAIDTTRKPFVYLLNNQPAGMETEIMYLFCETYGYKPTFSDVPFASGLAGLAGEKYDLVCGGLYMTVERKRSVNFSAPYMTANVIMVTYDHGETSFFAQVASSFESTLIKQNRWQLILSGLWVSLLIAALSVLFGSLLGFGVFFGKRSAVAWLAKLFTAFGRVCAFILHGTPTLVLLMLLYYTVFGNTDVSGTTVSVIGFTFIFASFVEHNLTRTVNSIDKGQTEGAYALGYSRNKTLFKIVMPQAMELFLPMYSEEVVTLIKATSVVGYIAVNDLTKMADIIRSNTFIAIFPLLAVTVCYFALTLGVTGVLEAIGRKLNPRQRKAGRAAKGEKA